MKYLLFLLPALLLAGCGPAGSNKPVVVAPVAPVTYPLSDIFTGFLQSAHSFVLTGKNEIQLPETWTATYIPGNITTFEGNSAHQTRISAQVAKLGGYIIDQGTGVIYFRLNPTRITGVESNSDTDVYANQVALPNNAAIGASGSLDTYTSYPTPSLYTTTSTSVDKWTLKKIHGVATFCINTITILVSGPPEQESDCYYIHSNHITGISILFKDNKGSAYFTTQN